jgi:AcrR family transcriptional regulator
MGQDGAMTAEQSWWRGVPADERQLGRRARLFDAALDRTDQEGIGSLSVRGLCADAGLTSRYFYESFRSLDDLVMALYEEVAETAVASIVEGMGRPARDASERAHNVIRAGTEFLTEDPRRSRFLLVHATARPDLHQRRRRFIADVVQLTADTTAPASGRGADPRSGAMASRFALGGLIEMATAYLEGEIGQSVDEFVDAATNLVLAVAERTAPRDD